MRATTWRPLLGFLAVLLFGAIASTLAPDTAQARVRATAAEARAMWRVVDPGNRCGSHRLAAVSSVRRSGWKYGTVTIAHRNCGNSREVLRAHVGRNDWRSVSGGSDWETPSYTCSRFVPAIVPLRAVRDLLGARACPFADAIRCGNGVGANPKGGYGLIIEDLRVKGMTCAAGWDEAGVSMTDDGATWSCVDVGGGAKHCIATNSSDTRTFQFRFGGGAG